MQAVAPCASFLMVFHCLAAHDWQGLCCEPSLSKKALLKVPYLIISAHQNGTRISQHFRQLPGDHTLARYLVLANDSRGSGSGSPGPTGNCGWHYNAARADCCKSFVHSTRNAYCDPAGAGSTPGEVQDGAASSYKHHRRGTAHCIESR